MAQVTEESGGLVLEITERKRLGYKKHLPGDGSSQVIAAPSIMDQNMLMHLPGIGSPPSFVNRTSRKQRTSVPMSSTPAVFLLRWHPKELFKTQQRFYKHYWPSRLGHMPAGDSV